MTIEFVLGLGVALLCGATIWFNRIALGLLLVPATVTPLVVGLVFKALLNPEYGVLGYALVGSAFPVPEACSPTRSARSPPWSRSTPGNGRR